MLMINSLKDINELHIEQDLPLKAITHAIGKTMGLLLTATYKFVMIVLWDK